MHKKVIALRGVANVGKSITIKKVYELLTSKYTSATREDEILSRDVRAVLTIKGLKIGIESQGDPGGRLEESLLLFTKVGCTVIVCATRTRGQTFDAVNKLEPTYEVVWLQQDMKSSGSEQEATNLAMASRIVREVEKAIIT